MKAKVRTIITPRDKRGTNQDYTMVINAGAKGTGKELGRVHVWGDSSKSEEGAIQDIIAAGEGYEIIW